MANKSNSAVLGTQISSYQIY